MRLLRGRRPMIRATLMACLLLGDLTWAQGAIRLKTRTIDTAQLVSQGRPAGRPLLGGRHYLLQFPSYPGPEVRQALARHGIRMLQYVPDNTLMVVAGQGSNIEGLGVSWAGELEAEDKISPMLATHASNAFLVIFYPDVDMEIGPGRDPVGRFPGSGEPRPPAQATAGDWTLQRHLGAGRVGPSVLYYGGIHRPVGG